MRCWVAFFSFFISLSSLYPKNQKMSSDSWHLSFPTIGITSPRAGYPFIPHQFTITELASRAGFGATIGFIDTAVNQPIINKVFNFDRVGVYDVSAQSHVVFGKRARPDCKLFSSHSVFAAGLVGGQTFFYSDATQQKQTILPVGIAPKSRMHIFAVFDSCGIAGAEAVVRGVEEFVRKKDHIACMSFKLDGQFLKDEKLEKRLMSALKKVPFCVAASGNSEVFNSNPVDKEAFPARLSAVSFDVGSFGFDGEHANISNFSCSEKGVGPLFVMPGENIYSVLMDDAKSGGLKPFVTSGTSISSVIMSGVLAIIIAEFPDFSPKQITTACYVSAIKLQKTTDWRERVILGTLDVRLALFILHVLRALRNLDVAIESKFLQIALIVKKILFYEAEMRTQQQFGKHVFLQDDFLEFIQLWQKHPGNQTFFENKTFPVVTDEMAKKVKECIANKNNNDTLSRSIAAILSESQENILPAAALERLKNVSD